MPRTGVNSCSGGDGLAPVPCRLVPWCMATEEEQQVMPTGQAGKLPALPSCVPLVLWWALPVHGGREVPDGGFAQAVFFVLGQLGLLEPCWSSSELYN